MIKKLRYKSARFILLSWSLLTVGLLFQNCSGGFEVVSGNVLALSSKSEMSCNFNGQIIASGSSVKAFQVGSVPVGSLCVSELRLCTDGSLDGTYTVGNCAVGAPASCAFNGQTLASGSKAPGFTAAMVPYGKLCTSVATTATCTNGSVNPVPVYPTCSVSAASDSILSFDSTTGNSGQTLMVTARLNALSLLPVSFVPMLKELPASNFSAKINEDVQTDGKTYTIAAGQTSIQFPVLLLNNQIFESTQKIQITGQAVSGTAQPPVPGEIQIVNLTPAPNVIASIQNVSYRPGDTATLNLSIDTFVKGTVTMKFHTQDVTAFSGIDFKGINIQNEVTCTIFPKTKNCASFEIPILTNFYESPLNDSASTARYKFLATADDLSCGILINGSVNCWGAMYPVPYLLFDVPASGPYKTISIGYWHGWRQCVINATDDVLCAGDNTEYQLGDGTVTNFQGLGAVDSGVKYAKISTSGWQHTCGITKAGILKCWGRNTAAEVGDGTKNPVTTPKVIDPGVAYRDVVARNMGTCGITTDGTLKCWGSVADGSGRSILSPTVYDAGTKYKSISMGNSETCGITDQGALKCWGSNTYGDIGDGTLQPAPTPKIVDPGVNYSAISLGQDFACAITNSNLKCWGVNNRGQIGDGTTTNRTLPTSIDSATSYGMFESSAFNSCALTGDGRIKCWGYGALDILGNYTTADVLTPSPIGQKYFKVVPTLSYTY